MPPEAALQSAVTDADHQGAKWKQACSLCRPKGGQHASVPPPWGRWLMLIKLALQLWQLLSPLLTPSVPSPMGLSVYITHKGMLRRNIVMSSLDANESLHPENPLFTPNSPQSLGTRLLWFLLSGLLLACSGFSINPSLPYFYFIGLQFFSVLRRTEAPAGNISIHLLQLCTF